MIDLSLELKLKKLVESVKFNNGSFFSCKNPIFNVIEQTNPKRFIFTLDKIKNEGITHIVDKAYQTDNEDDLMKFLYQSIKYGIVPSFSERWKTNHYTNVRYRFNCFTITKKKNGFDVWYCLNSEFEYFSMRLNSFRAISMKENKIIYYSKV